MSLYTRLPEVDEASDSPFSLTVTGDSPASGSTPALPFGRHDDDDDDQPASHVRINIPHSNITRPTSLKSPFPVSAYDDDHLLEDDGCFSPGSPNEPEFPKFIKLVGQPKPEASGDQVLETDPLTGAPIKPTPASVVNSVDHENVLVDVLEAENEDPFTLEGFDSLIQMHIEKEKDFIIARVTTVDPNDETRLYYSYYAAHHINKVLFRTQPEEGLLHRMKAKNPLNNMTIVGDVHYYVVSAASAIATSPQAENPRNSFDSVRSFSSIRSATSIRSMISIFSTASVGSVGSGRREFDRFRRKPRAKSSGVNIHDSEGSKAGLSRLLRVGQHGSRKRTLHLIMRPDAVENVIEDAVPLTEEEGGKARPKEGKQVVSRRKMRPHSAQPDLSERDTRLQSPVDRNALAAPKFDKSRRSSMDDAYAESNGINSVTSPIPLQTGVVDTNGAHGTTANFRAGSTTPKIHRRVRSISFTNEHHPTQTAQDWMRTHNQGTEPLLPTSKPDLSSHTRSLAIPNPLTSHTHSTSQSISISTRRNPSPTRYRPRGRTPLLEQALSPSSPFIPEPTYYIARYYASDDDFLMKSAIRAYFKQNALETQDAVLFTIPSSRDENTHLVMEGTEDHPALTGFVYAVSEDEDVGWFGIGGRNVRLFKWMLLGYVLFGFVVIKFIVPDEWAYVTAFVLIFLLCLIMILCL
ncbi:uncharacterized protein EV422DRAFT_542466 [Fimicolochytrium jonesii]|uniref:uncharacterized protein n=1 Tax=Fimicolochytrium jonesii TaxID=1396493 RepID=UPI0022FEF894|nr:uncharacterized protein EV422DRAFT_542466 [Fimicolochytrium jonesii]KAI8817110.1 hypothetical protein EV422DRAFT_542466 [Fimicolochytrium jonesii]